MQYDRNTISDYDYLFKVVIIGDSGVGKSSLLYRFVDNTFTETFVSTIGVDFKIKTIKINDKICKLQMWDTAGQERFKGITSAYYRGAHSIIMVYDITDRVSFDNTKVWFEEILNAREEYNADSVATIIVGNKCDLDNEREVQYSDGQTLAISKNALFIETSAKSNSNIEKMMNGLIERQIVITQELKPNTPIVPLKKGKSLLPSFGNDNPPDTFAPKTNTCCK